MGAKSMPISARLMVKPLEDAEPGELVRFECGNGAALAIVMSRGPDFAANFLILNSSATQFEGPEYTRFEPSGQCGSYGLTWVLEAIDDERTWPRNAHGTDQPGVLRVFSEGIGMVVRGADERRVNQFSVKHVLSASAFHRDHIPGTAQADRLERRF